MSKIKKGLLALPGTFIGVFVAAILFNEYLIIEIIGNPEQINSYHFGSEAMIKHGGIKYSSASTYSFSCLALATIGFTGAVIGQVTSLLKSNAPMHCAYAINFFSIVSTRTTASTYSGGVFFHPCCVTTLVT